jgi:ABC-type glycerol-3-phosphate transport system permease component
MTSERTVGPRPRARAPRAWDVTRLLFVTLLAVIALFPIVWLVSGSLKPLEQVFTTPVQWIPDPFQFGNYLEAIEATGFARPLLNSVIVTGSQVLINLVLCSLAGYGFAKFQFPGKEILFLGVIAMTLLPLQVIMIPLFLQVKFLGWIDTYPGLILPTAASAFGVFFMRQYISTIPDDYLDAARVDGAGELRLFRSVILPELRPALVTVGVIVGLASWDEFLWPLIVVGGQELTTAPLATATLRSLYQTPFHHLLAIAVVMVIPPLVVFLFAQRQIIRSISQTGIK